MDTAQIVASLTLGLFTLLGVCVAGFFSFLGAKHARQANSAVNHSGEEGHRIYELALQNHRAIHAIEMSLAGHLVEEEKRFDRIDKTIGSVCKGKEGC